MIQVGDPVPLRFQHPHRATDRFVRARVWNDAGTEIPGSPFTLSHVANGLYRNLSLVMPDASSIHAQAIAYDDAGFTVPSEDVAPSDEVFYRQEPAGAAAAAVSDAAFERLVGTVSADEIIGQVKETA